MNATVARPMFKSPGGFSRKHATPAAHEAAQREHARQRAMKAFESLRRFEDVELDLSVSSRLPIAERRANAEARLRMLDQRLGIGIGAAKEREALRDIIAS